METAVIVLTAAIVVEGMLLVIVNGFAGLGWKSWKRRWFILTRTSLVFFKNDPVS
jgi:hypothetical protein